MPTPTRLPLRIAASVLVVLAFAAAPARAEPWDFAPPPCDAGVDGRTADELLRCLAPTVRTIDGEYDYNRVGLPKLYKGPLGGIRAWVDPASAVVFIERRSDRIGGRDVSQLVYRIHFEKIPLRFSRYFFEAHRNPGLMVLLTVDDETGDVLFVSTVHTCGCYLAVVPTDAVDPEWLPADWSEEQALYGQRLPGRLAAADVRRGLRITLESQSHRVTAIEAGPGAAPGDRSERVRFARMSELEALPIEGRPGEQGSFFYEWGPLRGHVRGAWNPMEGLTAFGWLSLDPLVGMDKNFGDPEKTGTRFYTLLPFWLHEQSRLDRMDSLLRALGYRLPSP